MIFRRGEKKHAKGRYNIGYGAGIPNEHPRKQRKQKTKENRRKNH